MQALATVTVLAVALQDCEGRPWATVACGKEGFITFADDSGGNKAAMIVAAQPLLPEGAVSPMLLKVGVIDRDLCRFKVATASLTMPHSMQCVSGA